MTLPLFPLPNVVLFPNVLLPLHIFEDRYRAMVEDALGGDRIIGMVLLRDRAQDRIDEAPRVFPIGCSGVISHCTALDDGRFNIVLRGIEKFQILEEDHALAYRRARVEPIADTPSAGAVLGTDRHRLEQLLEQRLAATGSDSRVPAGMADGDLVNALSQYLDLDPIEKQALLECNGACARCRSLIELLEMQSLVGHQRFSATTQ